MMKGEVDRQGGCPGVAQLAGTDDAVIAIDGDALREPDPGDDHDRGNRPAEEAETGVSLPDVVHQRGGHHSEIVESAVHDRPGGSVTMTLVMVGLVEEEVGQLSRQPLTHVLSLDIREGTSAGHVEESSDEMGRRARQLS